MSTVLRWTRRFPSSTNNFDLVLENPRFLDSDRLNELLKRIESENHRGLTLSSRACMELRRFFNQPDSALKSFGYVLLSNWFMTQSGDRNSLVASACEVLWDALFPCRPTERLSSPAAGQNHVMMADAFAAFWNGVLKAQGDDVLCPDPLPSQSNIGPPIKSEELSESSDGFMQSRLRAIFDKQGLHCQVEGSAQALANFLRIVSGWDVQ